MRFEALDDAETVGQGAARVIAADAKAAVSERGRFVLALSRPSTTLLNALCLADLPWAKAHVFQVDERVAPSGHADRNATAIADVLLTRTALVQARLHLMPVEAPDLEVAAAQYAHALREVAGTPPCIDVVHLGLGSDGHTASLLPGDPVLQVGDRDVAVTGPYQGYRRMTLTFPALDRARRIVWVVTGRGKASMVSRLLAGDHAIPAGRVRRENALLLAEREA